MSVGTAAGRGQAWGSVEAAEEAAQAWLSCWSPWAQEALLPGSLGQLAQPLPLWSLPGLSDSLRPWQPLTPQNPWGLATQTAALLVGFLPCFSEHLLSPLFRDSLSGLLGSDLQTSFLCQPPEF